MRHGPRNAKHEKPSGWRCAAHRPAGQREWEWDTVPDRWAAEGMADLELVREDGRKPLVDRILEACEQHSESCDGSDIVFEMPHIGISMMVRKLVYSRMGIISIQIENLDRQSVGDVKGKRVNAGQ